MIFHMKRIFLQNSLTQQIKELIAIHRSVDRRVLGHFYDMKNQFWAGLDSWASKYMKKKFGADYEQLLRAFFYVFMDKFFLKI